MSAIQELIHEVTKDQSTMARNTDLAASKVLEVLEAKKAEAETGVITTTEADTTQALMEFVSTLRERVEKTEAVTLQLARLMRAEGEGEEDEEDEEGEEATEKSEKKKKKKSSSSKVR